jgi:pyruvate formate lyase activating enzyme
MVNLIVTDVNDRDDTIREVIENHLKFAGENIPIHFTRYFPAFTFRNPPTKIEKLERAVEIARKEGVEFAYVGNVIGHRYENTYCPKCGEILVHRISNRVLENRIKDERCPECRRDIYGVW